MLKHTTLTLVCVLLSGLIYGQKTRVSQDTIILQRMDTSFTFEHIIQQGQTLYSLSKIYKTTLDAIHHDNPNLMETELGIGDTIDIPLTASVISKAEELHSDHRIPLIYHVAEGETLFAIAHRWLDVETAYLKEINNLESTVLSLNTPLLLGYLDARYISAQVVEPDAKKIAEVEEALIQASKATVQGMEAIVEQGKAIWKASKSAGDQPYVLHRKAKLNSLVQLYNPMTGKRIHAKVVGRIPARNYDDNVMVVLTPFLADALKARDKAFFIKMKYTM